MNSLYRVLCVLGLVASFFAQSVFAHKGTDQSDLWYSPAESGWGMQLVQRNAVIFATLFVYGPNGSPTWYTATMDVIGSTMWSGDLYATTGPWFEAVPFNPALVTATRVGTMTWNAPYVESGTVTYTVNGVMVTKNVIRQTLVYDDYSGHYSGGLHADIVNCADPAFNGTFEPVGILNIAQSGQGVTLQTFPAQGANCTYSGTQTQSGQMGIIDGSYNCTDGTVGTFNAFEVQVNPQGITGRFTAANSVPAGCTQTGWFGGLVVTTF